MFFKSVLDQSKLKDLSICSTVKLLNIKHIVVPRHFYCMLIIWRFKSDSFHMLAYILCRISFLLIT